MIKDLMIVTEKSDQIPDFIICNILSDILRETESQYTARDGQNQPPA